MSATGQPDWPTDGGAMRRCILTGYEVRALQTINTKKEMSL
jgi:hypothetical protein